MKYILLLLVILISRYANAEDFLGNSLKKLGVMKSANKPGVVSDQLSGYATGGSIHARAQVSDQNLFNVQLPSLNMGCNGIDLFLGSFSYLSGDGIKNLLNNITSSFGAYATMLAIKSQAPMMGDILSQMEAMARFINGQNINSCQMGASIAAGLFPKTEASQQLACEARNMGQSKAADFFTARYDCTNADKAQTNKNEYKGLLGTEFNLVWHALKKQNPNLPQDQIEFLMSLSGTLIAKPSGDGQVGFIHRNSLLKDAKLLEKLVFGASGEELKLYKCHDNNKCLEVGYKNQGLDEKNSVIYQVRNFIHSLTEKYLKETHGSIESLTAEERHFIETTSVPILDKIKDQAALKGTEVELSVDEYAETMSFEYLVNYLDSMLEEVYQALSVLEYSQIEAESIKGFKEEIRYIKGYLSKEIQTAYQKINMLQIDKQRSFYTKQMLRAAFADYRSSY